MSETQLAAAIGVRERTITRWEDGKNDPDTKHVIALAETLQCSLVWLMTGKRRGSDEPAGVTR